MLQRRLYFLIFCTLLSGSLLSQKTITGTVLDEAGEPLIGVNVTVPNSATGTTSDFDGKFSLNVPQDLKVLEFSYIGYASREIDISTASDITVVLTEGSELLDEIVVTALGFEARKDEIGSTSSEVNGDAIIKSGEANLLNSLGGKASNVRIARSNGDPGAGSSIQIRGQNTISGSGNPLIILDGVPISNTTLYGGGNDVTGGRTGGVSQQSRLNDINPNDIESIQILKGASAAALWGSRAANGVLVITTKAGKAGQVKISFKSSRSFDVIHERMPLQTTWGQGRNGSYSPTLAESWGDYIPDRAGGEDTYVETLERFVAEDGTVYNKIDEKNSKETFVDKNHDNVFQTGSFWENNLSISGGNQNATYFFSLGRLDQDGIIRNSDYDRTNLRLNNKFILSDWLTISSKAGYTKSSSNRIQQNSNVTGLLLGHYRTPPDFDVEDYKGSYFNSAGVEFPGRHRAYRRYLGGSSTNPIYNNSLWTIFEQKATSELDRFIMNAEMKFTATPWLNFIVRGGVDKSDDTRVYFFPQGSASTRNSGVFSEDLIKEQELNLDAIGRATFELTSDVSLIATAGWNINDRKRRYNTGTITGFLVNSTKQTTSLNTAAENSSFSNNRRFIRSNRGYGTLAFDIMDQLYVNASGSLEAASSINGNYFYPAFDVAWQFTKSAVRTDFLSFGKLRASWGKVGVQPLPHRFQTPAETDFSYSTYSDPLDINLWGGGFRIDDDKGNPDLEPEIKTEWEIGTDLRFFNDKFSLSATYYQNNIEGLLISVAQTPSSGFDTQYANAASMENKGFEAEISYDLIRKKDFDFNVYGNWSTNRNLVTRLEGTETINLSPGASVSSRAIVGQPLGALFGTGSQKNEDGSFILTENGFPQITASPEVLGDPNPDWRAGLGFNANWKGIGFNILFEHSQGGEFSPRSLWVLRRFGTTEETANRITLDKDLMNFGGDLIEAGTTVRGNIANFGGGDVLLDETWYRTGIGGGFGDNQAYNFSIADATWTRLRQINLGYTITGEKFREKTKLQGITLGVSGRNLFIWDKIDGIDPEVNQVGVGNGFGIEYFTNPSTRSFLFNITFNY